MAPIIDIAKKDFERANKILELAGVKYSILKSEDKSDFIYVPSIKLSIAKERTLLGENWFDAQRELQSRNQKMLTVPEFVEFLKYTRENHRNIYNDITEVRSPWRAEWLDAYFKVQGKNLVVNYHVFDQDGNIVKKSEILDKDILMKDKIPGISLEDWLENPTKQGFPNKKTKSGDLYYWYPRSDDNSVAGFNAYDGGADLYCPRNPSNRSSSLGVRAAKQRE